MDARPKSLAPFGHMHPAGAGQEQHPGGYMAGASTGGTSTYASFSPSVSLPLSGSF